MTFKDFSKLDQHILSDKFKFDIYIPSAVINLDINCMRFLLILLLGVSSFSAMAQDVRFFTRQFQQMTSDRTENKRVYNFYTDSVVIHDYKQDTLVHKGVIYGLDDLAHVNEFAWYCISNGADFNYRDYFKRASGFFSFYSNGTLSRQILVKGNVFKYAQVWNARGEKLLENGSGKNECVLFQKELIYEQYADSLLVARYGVRVDKHDTIHYQFDKMAGPKEGLTSFYQKLVKVLRYPGVALLAGKEGRIYIQFIVDKTGKLTEFTPLSKEGYNFEAKTIKKLEALPPWNPAILRGKSVKSKFVLPVNFALQ